MKALGETMFFQYMSRSTSKVNSEVSEATETSNPWPFFEKKTSGSTENQWKKVGSNKNSYDE